MRAAGALASERRLFRFATRPNRAGQPGEAKAVLDEGHRAGNVQPPTADARASADSRRRPDRARTGPRWRRSGPRRSPRDRRARRGATGDAHYGYGEYAEAAELYRAALQKGGEDANLVNTRLGAALARAGQRAEARGRVPRRDRGARAELARYWLLWLEPPR